IAARLAREARAAAEDAKTRAPASALGDDRSMGRSRRVVRPAPGSLSKRVFRSRLQPVEMPSESVLGLTIGVDVFETKVGVGDWTPDQVHVRRARALVGLRGRSSRVVLFRARQHDVRTQAFG